MTLPSISSTRQVGKAVTYVLVVAGATVCTLAVVLVAIGSSHEQRLARGMLELLVVLPTVAVGLYAARCSQRVRFGFLLMGAGLIWSFTALAESSASLPYSIGRVTAWLIFPSLIYLMLAFPAGRLKSGRDRTLFGGTVLLITFLYIGSAVFVEAYPVQTPWATCTDSCPPNAFLVLDAQPAFMEAVIRPVREVLGIVLLMGITLSLASRMRTSTALQRRTNGPVLAMSIASSVILIAFLVTRQAAPGAPAVDMLGTLWSLCIPGIAMAFFVGLMRRRLFVGEVLGKLSVQLSGRLDGRELRDVVATALSDPTADVLSPCDAPERWRDTDGRVTSRAALTEQGRDMRVIRDGDTAPAALVHDPCLRDDEELLEAVSSLLLNELQRERLQSELRASVGALKRSRARIAKAADLERSRIERDLHDGAQQRLIMLRIRLTLVEELLQSDPAAGTEAVHGLGDEMEVAIDELRSLAHGVYPPILSDRGLKDALRSIVAGSPVPISLKADGVGRLSRELESAVYFVCVEAVQNAIKHTDSATAIRLSRDGNGELRFEIRDDGPGFDVPAAEFNGGLRNMHDRIEAVGGRLTIESSAGDGTCVRGYVSLN